jgi:signal transduction histidine kinase
MPATADSAAAHFRVIDDGSGISANDVAKIFEPLFTTKPTGAGTGLGLALASEIVKNHRGTLTLTPSFPRGTRATVDIPLAHAAESAA